MIEEIKMYYSHDVKLIYSKYSRAKKFYQKYKRMKEDDA